MPGEIVGDIFSGVFRFIIRIFADVILEILIKGFGYLIYRPFNKHVDPDGLKVTLVGMVAWGILLFGGYKVMSFLEIDRCLDAGGSYNYQLKECELSNR
ncbi:hypothetical protein [Litoribrevibacter albus]|uniref:Uncharacterized protein n=1 Tax=Litoribrevibacter albus TaxID=1473156 RepID=A0AA37W771_9GAMM|nr:hypothetical protein [Litoribrevibacter albus]GLQ30914.1 hypothetical protein GCM10007876_13930 [Litoribrevibacter albus]